MTDFTNSYAARKIPASVVVAIAAAGDDLAEIAIMALSYARDDSDIFIAVGLISKIAHTLRSEIGTMCEYIEDREPGGLVETARTRNNALRDVIASIRTEFA